MTLRRLVQLITFAGLAVAAAATFACDDMAKEPKDPYVVTAVPWTAPESLSYVLLDETEKEIGHGTLSITQEGDQLTLAQEFGDDKGNADISVLLTDPHLDPHQGARTLIDADHDERRTVATEYGALDNGDYGVRIRQQVFKPASSDDADSTRCNPLKLPESAFDNDSSLFLWRTLPFKDKLEVQYTASIANRRDSRIVTLTVSKPEQIETPAGSFSAWHVLIIAEGQSHDAWFEVDPPHRMVRYDNDQQVFLLEGPGNPPENLPTPTGVGASCE